MDTGAFQGGVGVLDCRGPPSIPPATISWSMNSVPINDTRHRVLQNGSLSITDVELVDAGMYSCTATNSFIGSSTTSQEVALSVLGEEIGTGMISPETLLVLYKKKLSEIF